MALGQIRPVKKEIDLGVSNEHKHSQSGGTSSSYGDQFQDSPHITNMIQAENSNLLRQLES